MEGYGRSLPRNKRSSVPSSTARFVHIANITKYILQISPNIFCKFIRYFTSLFSNIFPGQVVATNLSLPSDQIYALIGTNMSPV